MAESMVPLALYSKALDEIYELRRAAAYEAEVVDAHLTYKTFPKTRRRYAEVQAERLRLCASGKVQRAYAGSNSRSLRSALERASGSSTLTRAQWEDER